MAEKIVFTMAKLASLEPFRSGRRTVYDQRTPGLTICITKTGSKSFYLYGRYGGRVRRVRIGGFPEVTVDTAREQAKKIAVGFMDGKDPVELRRIQRGELTLGQLFDLYIEFHAEKLKRPSSVAEDRGLWRRYLQPWESRKLSTITNPDVIALHTRIGKKGRYSANRALSLLQTMFTVARKHEVWKKPNPCEGVDRFDETSRDRFLGPDELRRFLEALETEPNQDIADAFRLMLLTGARRNNVLSMRWPDIDLEGGVWRIPQTKQGEPQRVPLSPDALIILKRIEAKGRAQGAAYVFPAQRSDSESGHLRTITRAWARIIKRAGLEDVRPHDLRRTFGSWQAAAGSSVLVIGKSLGHRQPSTTEIYARLNLDSIRASVNQATAAMMQVTGKQKKGGK